MRTLTAIELLEEPYWHVKDGVGDFLLRPLRQLGRTECLVEILWETGKIQESNWFSDLTETYSPATEEDWLCALIAR